MKTLKIDQKWAIEYDPGNNDKPMRVTRYGEPFDNCDWPNYQTAMFYALLEARSAAA